MAYAIGLIATDGNLSPNGYHVCLVSTDLEQLATFGRILETRNRINKHPGGYARTACYHLVLGDRLFHDWLVDIGITPRKTHTIGEVAVPDEFFRDFLRGHLDGDGSITTYVDRYCTKMMSNVPCLKRKRAVAEPFLTGDIRDFRHPPGFDVREEREGYTVAAG